MTPEEIKKMITPDENGLLPCGCGGRAGLYHFMDYKKPDHSVQCETCKIHLHEYHYRDKTKEMWNKAQSAPAIKHLIEVIGRLEAVIKSHDEWHCTIGEATFKDVVTGESYELDLTEEYCDSSLYERTRKAMLEASQYAEIIKSPQP